MLPGAPPTLVPRSVQGQTMAKDTKKKSSGSCSSSSRCRRRNPPSSWRSSRRPSPITNCSAASRCACCRTSTTRRNSSRSSTTRSTNVRDQPPADRRRSAAAGVPAGVAADVSRHRRDRYFPRGRGVGLQDCANDCPKSLQLFGTCGHTVLSQPRWVGKPSPASSVTVS